MVAAQARGPLTSPAYRQALARCHRVARAEGIDLVVARHRLDAIVCPTSTPQRPIDFVDGDGGGADCTTPAAVAGYPHVTVPMGYVLGMPVGLSFFCRAWTEPVLIKAAYAYEQASKVRRAAAVPAHRRAAGGRMTLQYIFSTLRLGKVVPPSRHVLKDISLSFFPDAKIGVIGLNGAGKSSLLKIMAGVDPDFIGEARPAPGIRIGWLPQEPRARSGQGRARQRRGGRRAAPRPAHRFRDDQREVRRADERRGDERVAGAAGRSPAPHRRRGRLGAGPPSRRGDGRAAAPAARTPTSPRSRAASGAGWRCAGCSSRSRTCCSWTSRPTISTPSRWRGSSVTSRSSPAASSP